jgi:hypothetical protein
MAQTLKSLFLHERLFFSGMLTSKIKAQLTRLGLQLNYRKFNVSVKFSPDIRSHFIKNFSPIKISAAREIYCSFPEDSTETTTGQISRSPLLWTEQL